MPVLHGYDHFGGRHGESAAVANVLRFLGVKSPQTGKAYTEEMLFGLGGGLGFAYWVFDYEHLPSPILSVGFRRFGWEGFDVGFVADMCARVGAKAEVRETSSRAKAARELGQVLSEARPPIVTADWGKLPCSPVPDEIEYVPHIVAVAGTEGDDLLVDDLEPKPCRVSAEALAASRAAVRSMHHRVRLLTPGDPPADATEAIRDAFADCASSLLDPLRPNAGLSALQKWSRMVSSRSETKAWRKVFGTPERLSSALEWARRWIEIGTGGGAFRLMYADFLEEAAPLTPDTAEIRALAKRYRGLGRRWSSFASKALSLSRDPDKAFDSLDSLAGELEAMHADEVEAANGVREAARDRAAVRA